MMQSMFRSFSTLSSGRFKIDMSVVSKIRKQFEGASLAKIRSAVEVNNNDIQASIAWLEKEMAKEGAKKSQRNRKMGEGLVAVVERKGVGSVIMEMNCETDFVARNKLFHDFIIRVSDTALLLQSSNKNGDNMHAIDINELSSLPLLPYPESNASHEELIQSSENSVSNALSEISGRLGEKLCIRKGIFSTIGSKNIGSADGIRPFTVMSSFVHGAINPVDEETSKINSNASVTIESDQNNEPNLSIKCGRVASVVLMECIPKELTATFVTEPSLKNLGKQLAQHIVGMKPNPNLHYKFISASDISDSNDADSESSDLLKQPFLFQPDQSVHTVIKNYLKSEKCTLNSLRIVSFARIECGEALEEEHEVNFVTESQRITASL